MKNPPSQGSNEARRKPKNSIPKYWGLFGLSTFPYKYRKHDCTGI
jgi:hypothetical protein